VGNLMLDIQLAWEQNGWTALSQNPCLLLVQQQPL